MEKGTSSSVVQTPLGYTEQNTHSDNLLALCLLVAVLGLGGIAVLVLGIKRLAQKLNKPTACNNDLAEL